MKRIVILAMNLIMAGLAIAQTESNDSLFSRQLDEVVIKGEKSQIDYQPCRTGLSDEGS